MKTYIVVKNTKDITNYSYFTSWNGKTFGTILEAQSKISGATFYEPESFAARCNDDDINLADNFIIAIYITSH